MLISITSGDMCPMATAEKPKACILCKKSNPKYTNLAQMKTKKSNAYQWLKDNNPVLDEATPICLPCFKQIDRNYKNPDFTPRWVPKIQKANTICCIEGCKHPLYSKTNLVTAEQLYKLLDERVTAFSVDDFQASLGLCQDHYTAMYRQLHQATLCASCGCKPRKGLVLYRHCPKPEKINAYINSISDDDIDLTLTDESTVCYTCYLYFNRILQQFQPCNTSIDSVVDELRKLIENAKAKGENLPKDSYIDIALGVTGLKLAQAMREDEVLLLPILYEFFRATLADMCPTIGPHEKPSIRWLLSRLNLHFGQILKVECKHRRFGSIVHHVNCDLSKAVSLALGRGRMESKRQEPSFTLDNQLQNVASYLNEKVHKQAKSFISAFGNCTDKYTTFDIEELFDTQLMNFIHTVTQSVRTKRKLSSSENKSKRVREAYLLCVMLFCTNSQCSMPFHILLTEAILCHGGSQQLVTILNRVGAVAFENKLTTVKCQTLCMLRF